MKIRQFLLCLGLSLMLAGLVSCRDDELGILERENLFSMDIGKMEDQLFIQQEDGVNARGRINLRMNDGFFQISNGDSFKVMEFNSFGDLISLFYNPSENPEPVIISSEKRAGTDVTRGATTYSFNNPGDVIKTSGGDLLVDDLISEMRWEDDENIDARLDRIVLRFDRNGDFVSYLGQEGLGGTPFPYIQALYTSGNDEVVVVTRNPGGWRIYWFTRMGDPLYMVDFRNELLPSPDGERIVSIENIFPDPDSRICYLKLDYYLRDKENNDNIKFDKSVIYWYDLGEQKYTGSVDLPRNIVKSEEPVIFEAREHEYLYEFLGVAHGPYFYLMSPDEGTFYRLVVLSPSGQVEGRALINFSDEEIFYRSYSLNRDGILSAIVVGEYGADVVWWRSDRFIEEKGNENRQFFKNAGN